MRLFRRRHDAAAPRTGTAEVTQAWRRPQGGTRSNCRMTLRLAVPGLEGREVEHHEWSLSPDRWPTVGLVVPVTVRGTDDVTVDWDAVFGGTGGLVGGAVRAAAEVGLGVSITPVDRERLGEIRDSMIGDVGADQSARVAEVAQLFASGAITAEEYDAQLKRILGG